MPNNSMMQQPIEDQAKAGLKIEKSELKNDRPTYRGKAWVVGSWVGANSTNQILMLQFS